MRALRQGLEHWTRDWTFTRHMPASFGGAPIRVTTSAGLRYLFKPMSRIDPLLLGLARELVRPGASVWDVGANVGLFAVAAAATAGATGSVMAVEADVWLVSLLRQTARLQPKASAPIEIVPAAATSGDGIARFCIAQRARSSNHLAGFGHSQTGGVSEVQTVAALRLDTLLASARAPDLVKIDVEGAEHGVLLGAERVLTECRPLVVCEVGEESADACSQLLARHGYVLFDAERAPRDRAPLQRAVWATLAVPRERATPERA